MGKPLDGYLVGQLVVSKRGKDAGHSYVIVGFLGGSRLALADARRFNVASPKSKNPKHIQPTGRVIAELKMLADAGKNIDHGVFRRYCGELGVCGRAYRSREADDVNGE
ncbi:hypothetical protein AGMMS50276_25100 [Synergistales bacterium]|nr:hypothetical protein AGMMS50276_25100 [Synergistales bacterium]